MKRFMIVLLSISIAITAVNASEGTAEESKRTDTEKNIKQYEVTIEGLKHLEPDEIYGIIGVETKSWFEFWKSDKHYITDSLLRSAPDSLRGYLDSKGYYDATFKITKEGDRVTIKINEGEPVKVSDVEIDSDYPIDDIVRLKKGDVFETEKFSSIKAAIKSNLLKDGYCSYDLDTKAYVDLDKKSVDLVYKLKKGDLCYFGNTTIAEKPDSIPEKVLLSRLRYREGDVFTTEKVNNTYTALNQLGVFGRTLIDTDKKFFNVVPPEIHTALKEKLHRYTVAVGYDSKVGMRAKATYNHYNFLGGARNIELSAEYSSELKKIEANFFQPALFGWNSRYFDFYAKTGYFEEEYDNYNEKNAYLNMKLRHIEGDLTVDTGLALENIKIEKTGYDPSVIGGNFLMFYPYGEVVWDKRDSKLDPKNGYYLSLYAEYGLPFDEEASNYLKWLAEARYIKTFGLLTLAGVGKFGVIDDSSGVLPASKYFYAGGSYSNRAYGDKDIGYTISPTEDGSIGGRTWLNFSAEADYQIIDKVSGALFYDATMLSEGTYDFNAAWIQSAGVGVRYATPMGPIKADFAVNTHDPSINRISFMIGQSF